MMQRAVQQPWTICITSVHRCFTTSLSSISCYRRIARQSSPRATVVPCRTMMLSPQWTCTPRVFPTAGFKLLDPSAELEGETLPNYQPSSSIVDILASSNSVSKRRKQHTENLYRNRTLNQCITLFQGYAYGPSGHFTVKLVLPNPHADRPFATRLSEFLRPALISVSHK